MSLKITALNDKHFTNMFDDNNAIVVFDLLGYDRKSLAVRLTPMSNSQGYVVEVTSDQGYRPAVNVIRQSKFADLINIEKPKATKPTVVAFANIISEHKVTAEAEYVNGALVVLIQQHVPEQEKVQHIAINCKDDCEQESTSEDSITKRYNELLKKFGEITYPSKEYEKYANPWKYTEKYWLDDKPVDKTEFEKATGKKTDDFLNTKFGDDLDSMFKVFSDVFGDRK